MPYSRVLQESAREEIVLYALRTRKASIDVNTVVVEWRAEWRREDALDKERNLDILRRAQDNPDPYLAWLGYMGFAKEEEVRLKRKLCYLQREAQYVQH